MNASKGIFRTLALALLATALGCSEQPAASESGRPVIAVIPKGTIHEFWRTVHAGALKAADEMDVEVIWKGPLREDDRESQVAVMEGMIVRGVDGIVLAPLDDTALRPQVGTAQRAGIPVVIFDSGLKGDDYVSYVATDNFAAGRIGGTHLGELLGGRGRVAVLRYSEGSDSTTRRENGFLDGLAAFADIEVVSANQYAGVTTESALTAAENLLTRFRNADGVVELDGLCCATEPTTLGILRALENMGEAGRIKLIGFDCSDKMLAALDTGHLHGFVVQNPLKIGYLGVLTMARHLQGQPVDKRVDTGATLITPANVNQPEIRELLQPDLSQWLD